MKTGVYGLTRAEYEELLKNKFITIDRAYSTHWKNRAKEELGIDLLCKKGETKAWDIDQKDPAICEVKVNPTDDKCFCVVASVMCLTDKLGHIRVQITLVWSDALNSNPELTGSVIAFQKNLSENVWMYTAVGFAVTALIFIILKILGAF